MMKKLKIIMQIPPFTFIVIGGKQNSLIKIEQFKKESVMIRKKGAES
ncbi:hypothetical protein MGA3_06055 [Bacillus methanolicus MGA3]|nr:hypothetical protein MGA3_06055 [Bacillus methanolicus MGA3]